MRLALLVTLAIVTVVVPAAAGSPTGPFEEAGRLVDQLAGRLGSLGADLVQQMQPGRGGMGGMGGGGMMERMMGDPAERPLITIMLHHRTELGLSPDQVSRLETLRGDFTREAIRRGADIRIAELDVNSLLEQDPVDLGKVEAKVREVAQLRADLRIARLRAIEQGKAVLTPEQRTRLQAMLSGGMHHGHGAGSGDRPGGIPAPRRSADTGIQL
jgi:Spy/CpxP family protein refolding chaperone